MGTRFALLAALLVSALAVIGAGYGKSVLPSSAYREVPCWFELPADLKVTCHRLTVPESRAGRSKIQLQLPVVSISMPRDRLYDDPVVYIAGGPGDGAWIDSDRIDFWWWFVRSNGWLRQRELILYDQRGTGLSTPRMDCPEIEALTLPFLEIGLDRERQDSMLSAATQECRARVEKEGHDPLSYATRDSAQDLHALHQALGNPKWNLYGLSYGTRVVLTYLRDYPGDARSIILDSVVPPEIDFYGDDPWRTQRAFKTVFDSCGQDAECSSWYPNLEDRLVAVVRRLNETPLNVDVTRISNGEEASVMVTGELVIGHLFRHLYNRDDIARVPQIIDIFDRDDDRLIRDEVAQLVELSIDRPDWGDAMGLSVDCYEEVPFADLAGASEAYRQYPLLESFANDSSAELSCKYWPMPKAPAFENRAVSSDVPALVLAGTFDPVTPPIYAKKAAANLANSHYFEFATVGHDVLTNNACAGQLAGTFLNEPGKRPDRPCLGHPVPLRFLPPAE